MTNTLNNKKDIGGPSSVSLTGASLLLLLLLLRPSKASRGRTNKIARRRERSKRRRRRRREREKEREFFVYIFSNSLSPGKKRRSATARSKNAFKREKEKKETIIPRVISKPTRRCVRPWCRFGLCCWHRGRTSDSSCCLRFPCCFLLGRRGKTLKKFKRRALSNFLTRYAYVLLQDVTL